MSTQSNKARAIFLKKISSSTSEMREDFPGDTLRKRTRAQYASSWPTTTP